MRKSLVLALVLVFAIAGAAFAAEVDLSATFGSEVSYKSGAEEEVPFLGDGYTTKTQLDVELKVTGEDDVWNATVNVEDLYGAAGPSLGFYRLTIDDGTITADVWGKHANSNATIGDKGDALELLAISGNNQGEAPYVRLGTNLAGVALTGQVENADSNAWYLNAETSVDAFTLGATIKEDLDNNEHRFAVYGGADLGVANVNVAYASTDADEEDNTAMGVKVEAQVIDPLKVVATYQTVGENYAGANSKIGVNGTYTEGLLQAYVAHEQNTDAETSTNTVRVRYRGSEGNVAFGDLFHNNHYWKNVAPAFEAEYKMSDKADDPATTITLKATAPVMPGQLWVNGSVVLRSNEDTFKVSTDYPAESVKSEKAESRTTVTVSGYAPVGKWVFKPSFTSESFSDVVMEVDDGGTTKTLDGNVSSVKFELNADYKVAEDAKITFGIGQTTYSGTGAFEDAKIARSSKIGFEVNF